jgi:hypothetical protein
MEDYYKRIREKTYETVEETTWPFIRIINVCLMRICLIFCLLTRTDEIR